jgi:proteasome accessory factor B
VVSFEYLNKELSSEVRRVNPYRLSNSLGFWYLIAWDVDKSAVRTFRLDRFSSSVSTSGKNNAFEVDLALLDAHESSQMEETSSAVLLVRKGKAPSLRNEGVVSEFDAEWDRVDLQYYGKSQLLREVLWAGENAIILEPQELRDELISSLKVVVANHG